MATRSILRTQPIKEVLVLLAIIIRMTVANDKESSTSCVNWINAGGIRKINTVSQKWHCCRMWPC